MPTNTHWDQKRSLAKYDSIGIDAPVTLPELEENTDTGFSAADYLTLHSGLIVSGEYINEDFKKKLATSRDAKEGVLELGFSVPIALGMDTFSQLRMYCHTMSHSCSTQHPTVVRPTSITLGFGKFIATTKPISQS
jgi:hypothetical protein